MMHRAARGTVRQLKLICLEVKLVLRYKPVKDSTRCGEALAGVQLQLFWASTRVLLLLGDELSRRRL